MVTNPMQADTEWGLATLAFKVQALQFDLNRELKYISMKDQVIRGRTLMIGAKEANLIGQKSFDAENKSHVLIIGGGIGGISAALTACELGLRATVIEPAPLCFPLLGQGSDRLFSATVYDWPHLHAGSHVFPHLHALRGSSVLTNLKNCSVLRFPDRPETGEHIRKELLAQLAKYQIHYGSSLDIRTKHYIAQMDDVSANSVAGFVNTTFFDNLGAEVAFKSEIVIFTLGFGLDSKLEQTAAGKEFFSYQGLKSDLAKAAAGKQLVQIIGAGDGGLQEALRFILDDRYHDLHEAVTLLERELNGHGVGWLKFRCTLQSAEDHAVKSLMWGYSEDIIFSELDQIYDTVIKEMLANYPLALDQWASTVLRPVPLIVELIDTHTYSKRVYALNRFLTMLFTRLTQTPSRASLHRVIPAAASPNPDVVLSRAGFGGAVPTATVGTASEEDLLRRIAFRAIPMNLDTVV
jgi:hypothetical protein